MSISCASPSPTRDSNDILDLDEHEECDGTVTTGAQEHTEGRVIRSSGTRLTDIFCIVFQDMVNFGYIDKDMVCHLSNACWCILHCVQNLATKIKKVLAAHRQRERMHRAIEHEIMLSQQRYEAGIYSDFDVDDDTNSDSGSERPIERPIAWGGPCRVHLRPGLFVGPDGAPDPRVAEWERCFREGSMLQALARMEGYVGGYVGAQASGLLEPTGAPSSSAPRQPGAWDTIVADA